MSYNNYVDADAARRAAFDFAEPCVAIMKHANPCGIAIGADLAEAHRKAHACDPVSAYGGVIAANGTVTAAMAEQVAEIFTEVIIAPDFEPAALDILTSEEEPARAAVRRPRRPAGGRTGGRSAAACCCSRLTRRRSPATRRRTGSSRRAQPVGAGDAGRPGVRLAGLPGGQVQRHPAGRRPGHRRHRHGPGEPGRLLPARGRQGGRARGRLGRAPATPYFPFADGLQVLADAGVRAIAEPGGSIRDDEVIAAAEAAGVTLYFTGVRHFYH